MINKWNLISDLIITNQYKNIAEVGVSKGDTVLGIMNNLNEKQYKIDNYFGIDPFLDPYYAMPEDRKNKLAHWFYYKHLKYTSDVAVDYIKELDLVFIDGCHVPEIMAKDFIDYGDKIKIGGCIVGHDYGLHIKTEYGDYSDITKYVDAYFGADKINTIRDARDESGKPNYLWWTYKVEEGVYAKIRPDSI